MNEKITIHKLYPHWVIKEHILEGWLPRYSLHKKKHFFGIEYLGRQVLWSEDPLILSAWVLRWESRWGGK